MRLAFAAAFTLMAGAALPAAAAPKDCMLQITPSASQWEIKDFDPFAGTLARGEFDVTLFNVGEKACRGDLMIDTKGEAFGLAGASGPRLIYQLVDEYGSYDVTPRAGRTLPRHRTGQPLTIAPGQRLVQRFSLTVDTSNLPSDGLFQQNVVLSLEDRDRPNDAVANRNLTLALRVTPSAVMGLSGAVNRTATGARVNLEELTPGSRSLPLALFVRSTRGYRVSLDSQNRGRLVRGQSGWSIPYGIALGDRPVNLQGPASIETTGATFRNDSYPLSVTIGDVANRRAGTYSDTVTVTVAAL